ncbi:hypothetical protein D3C84_1310480 [compost metagenome]
MKFDGADKVLGIYSLGKFIGAEQAVFVVKAKVTPFFPGNRLGFLRWPVFQDRGQQ